MSAKYQFANNATTGDRLLNVGTAVAQLSTGDCVMLARDPSAADPLKITLQLVVGHTAPATIATLSSGGSGTIFYNVNAGAQLLSLCVDQDDNIYVFGAYGGPTTLGKGMAYQAFVKQAGVLAWTPAPANAQGGITPATAITGTAAIWCNTGGGTGGAGHVLVICSTTSGATGALIYDAGLLQTGAGALTQSTTNPSFLANGTTAISAGSNLDLDADAPFASSGAAVSADGTNGVLFASWGVSSSGRLTVGGGNSQFVPCATLTATTKLRIVRLPSYNATFGFFVPSSANAGQISVYTASSLTSSGGLQGPVDSGTASNFPAPSASLSWDVTAGSPTTGNYFWIYGWSSGTATTMLRLPITLGFYFAPQIGTVVTDDTTVGSGTNTTIRVVSDPVDFQHIDWQSYDTVTPFSLLGDYSALPVPPNEPTLVAPVNASSSPMFTAGGTFDWAFSSPQLGDAQTAYALMIQEAGSAPQWWNAGTQTLVGAEVFNTSAVTAVTIPSGKLAASNLWTWSVAVQGVGGTSLYSTSWLFGTYPAPAAPTLSVSYDAVNNRNALIIDGSVSTAPTGSIEFSDDGGVTWQFVFAAEALPNVYPGPLTVYDREVQTQTTRQYRARNWATSPLLNYSAYVTASQVAPKTTSYWLIDLLTGVSIAVTQKAGSFTRTGNFSRTAHQPLGRTNAVVITDVTHGPNLAVTWVTQNPLDAAALDALLEVPRPLFWQDPIDASKYIMVMSYTDADVPVEGAPWLTYHEHAVTYVTVDRPTS